MIQLDLFECLSSRFEARQTCHRSITHIMDKCWAILDKMDDFSLSMPIQLRLFEKLFHPGWNDYR